MRANGWVVAAIGVGLLAGGLAAAPGARAAHPCMVTVITTDAKGNVDPKVMPKTMSCRPGETDGGEEYYNPYTGGFAFLAATGTGGYSSPEPGSGVVGLGNDHANGPAGTNAALPVCTPAIIGGTKIKAGTVTTPAAATACPKAAPPASR